MKSITAMEEWLFAAHKIITDFGHECSDSAVMCLASLYQIAGLTPFDAVEQFVPERQKPISQLLDVLHGDRKAPSLEVALMGKCLWTGWKYKVLSGGVAMEPNKMHLQEMTLLLHKIDLSSKISLSISHFVLGRMVRGVAPATILEAALASALNCDPADATMVTALAQPVMESLAQTILELTCRDQHSYLDLIGAWLYNDTGYRYDKAFFALSPSFGLSC